MKTATKQTYEQKIQAIWLEQYDHLPYLTFLNMMAEKAWKKQNHSSLNKLSWLIKREEALR